MMSGMFSFSPGAWQRVSPREMQASIHIFHLSPRLAFPRGSDRRGGVVTAPSHPPGGHPYLLWVFSAVHVYRSAQAPESTTRPPSCPAPAVIRAT